MSLPPIVIVHEDPAPIVVVSDALAANLVVNEAPAPIVIIATQGPAGPAGVSASITLHRTAASTLSGHRAVVPLDDGTVGYADAGDPTHIGRPIWLTTGAAVAGELVELLALGEFTEPSWAWAPGQAIYLGAGGLLTQTAPADGFQLQVALPATATTLFFNPKLPIVVFV